MLQEEMMVMMVTVMTSSRLEMVNGENWGNSPEKDLYRDYPLSISMNLQTTVIIELNCYFLCKKNTLLINFTSLLIQKTHKNIWNKIHCINKSRNRSQGQETSLSLTSELRLKRKESIRQPWTSPPGVMLHISGLRTSADRPGTRIIKRYEK